MLFRRRQSPSRIQRLRVAVWPRHSWARSTRYFSKRVLRLTATPHAIAIGFAAGAFASFTPFIGLHFLIAFALAYVVGGNLIAAAFGTGVGNPLTFPFIWTITFQVGQMVLRGEAVPSAPANLEAEFQAGLFSRSMDTVLPLIKPMLVGAIPLGLATAIICYVIVFKSVEVYQRRRRKKLERKRALENALGQDPESPAS
ncbi:MAG: DUF2062 domain-containing protein [Roseibium sp.]|nr:DUF2062 domain-containing protein [Roseibium sp.]